MRTFKSIREEIITKEKKKINYWLSEVSKKEKCFLFNLLDQARNIIELNEAGSEIHRNIMFYVPDYFKITNSLYTSYQKT